MKTKIKHIDGLTQAIEYREPVSVSGGVITLPHSPISTHRFKLVSNVAGPISIKVGNEDALPLKNMEKEDVTELPEGIYEVIADAGFFLLRPSGGSGGAMEEFFGDGSDGVLNTTGNLTLTSTLNGPAIVRQYESITINAGHTLTTSQPCGGLVLFSRGDVVINGTISMSFKAGTIPSNAIEVILKTSQGKGDVSSIVSTMENLIGGSGGTGGKGSGAGGEGGIGRLNIGGFGGGGSAGSTFRDASGNWAHSRNGGGIGNFHNIAIQVILSTDSISAISNVEMRSQGIAGIQGGGAIGTSIAWNGGTARGGSGGAANGGGGGGGGGSLATGSGSSSGGAGSTGEYAGGLILIISGGDVIINGVLMTNGGVGGAGGVGNASLFAGGGRAHGGGGGGGGGGGVVALYHKGTFTNTGTLSVSGGTGGIGGVGAADAFNSYGPSGTAGSVGTIHIQKL